MRKIRSELLGRIVKAMGAGVAICLLASGLMAALIAGEQLTVAQLGYGVVLTLLAVSFVAAKIMMKNKDVNGLVSAAISLVTIMLVLLVGNWLSGADGVNGLLETALVVGAGVLAALLIGGGKKRKRHRIKR